MSQPSFQDVNVATDQYFVPTTTKRQASPPIESSLITSRQFLSTDDLCSESIALLVACLKKNLEVTLNRYIDSLLWIESLSPPLSCAMVASFSARLAVPITLPGSSSSLKWPPPVVIVETLDSLVLCQLESTKSMMAKREEVPPLDPLRSLVVARGSIIAKELVICGEDAGGTWSWLKYCCAHASCRLGVKNDNWVLSMAMPLRYKVWWKARSHLKPRTKLHGHFT